MSTIQKIIIGAISVIALGVAGYFLKDSLPDLNPDNLDNPGNITADYQDLLAEAEQLRVSAGANCDNKKNINKKIAALEKNLADLAERKKKWLDNVPKLPDVEPEIIDSEGRPGSEVPELTSDVPPLPEIDMDSIIVEEIPGSQVPELTSDVPPLPELDMESIIVVETPGSEVPELTSDVPPLPEIDPNNVINPNEYVYMMADNEQKINNILQTLKALCQEEDAVKKPIPDKCSDACKKYKDCAAYTEDATPTDLNDAYNTCMEECATWSVDMIKCINGFDIKNPNDCISFLQCQLPQFYEETYLP